MAAALGYTSSHFCVHAVGCEMPRNLGPRAFMPKRWHMTLHL
eukprot:CAMPEP_0171058940 /NCGR_PEP_ID=MMETSP0766_2-20121228/2855_1 /TAXON_ID=439317 /ORGANISM="Gambierdiscus australes, Strain CAWD 149" /LENGTH=41 /DNA_ID= /DNA_START= /DNA_END= /DNA_ORIENTATION=